MHASWYMAYLLITCRVHNGGEKSHDTMVSRAHSTLDGHPEVKQRKAMQVFPVSGYNTKSQASRLTTGLLLGLEECLLYNT